MHWIYLIHRFYNLSWITDINYTFPRHSNYWDAPVYWKEMVDPEIKFFLHLLTLLPCFQSCSVFSSQVVLCCIWAEVLRWLGCWRGQCASVVEGAGAVDCKAHYGEVCWWWAIPTPFGPMGMGAWMISDQMMGVCPCLVGFLLWRPWLGALVGGDWMEYGLWFSHDRMTELLLNKWKKDDHEQYTVYSCQLHI